jgi:hypothetical protein
MSAEVSLVAGFGEGSSETRCFRLRGLFSLCAGERFGKLFRWPSISTVLSFRSLGFR